MSSQSPLSLTFGERNAAFLSTAEDFRKQRTKITRRIQKLKKYLKIQNKNTKNYKNPEFTIENYDSDGKYYLISILTVERNWVYALELRALIALTDGNNYKSKQQLLLTRLKRALKSAQSLVSISVNESDSIKRLEILAYKELLSSFYYLNIKKWNNAIQSYSIVRLALQYLEELSYSDNKILYKDIIEEFVDESFKLAIYRTEAKSSIDLTDYSKTIASTLQSNDLYQLINEKDEEFLKPTDISSLIKEIQWRDYSAKVKDDTSSRLLSRVFKIELDSLDAFDKSLALWQDLLETHQNFISRLNDSGDDDDSQDDQIFLAYIKYNLLLTRVNRDQTLLSNNQKESLRILDAIVDTLKELSELPGVYSDDELLSNLQTLSTYYSNLKLRILGLFFFNDKSYTKALLLASQIVKSLESLNLTIDEFSFISQKDINNLLKESQDLLKNSHILSQLESEIPSNRKVVDNLNKYSKNFNNIIGLKLESVPVKPVLFDIAFNYVSYVKDSNSGERYYQEAAISSTEPDVQTDADSNKKKGFFGGLFGR